MYNNNMYNNNLIRVCTHSGKAHIDEIMAILLVKLINDKEVSIVRKNYIGTDDEKIFDYIIDVGYRYDGIKYFDHHQDGKLQSSCKLIYDDVAKEKIEELNISKEVLNFLDKIIERVSIQDTQGPKSLVKDSSVNNILTEMLFSERLLTRYFEKYPETVIAISENMKKSQNYNVSLNKKIKNIKESIKEYIDEEIDFQKEYFGMDSNNLKVKILYKFISKYIDYLHTVDSIGYGFIEEKLNVSIESITAIESLIHSDSEFTKSMFKFSFEDNFIFENEIEKVSEIINTKSKIININKMNILIIDPIEMGLDLSIPTSIINAAQSNIIDSGKIDIVIGYDNSRINEISNIKFNRTIYKTYNMEDRIDLRDILNLLNIEDYIFYKSKFLISIAPSISISEIIEKVFKK